VTGTSARILLVRHALAGSRQAWAGPDTERPLDERGRSQSAVIAGTLASLAPGRLLSSPYRRCIETLEPFAEASGIKLEREPALAERALDGIVERMLDSLEGTVALCTHGDICERVLAWATAGGLGVDPNEGVDKGAIWLLDPSAAVATLFEAPVADRERA
jgi:8-oxo-dGTP diphosphatase